ncbi:MAG: ApbE family lipoprotein [Segetibacter sp.]|nr:ApbE family lipoprotein [Segetibacter sp.]
MINVLIIWLVALLQQTRDQPAINTYHLTGFAQGTTYSITYYAVDSFVTQKHVDNTLASIDSSLSIYKPYSQISKFNASSSGLFIDTFFQAVVKKSIEVYNATGGAFDITVYPLVKAWGFGAKTNTSIPDSAAIKSLLPCIGTGNIQLNKNNLQKNIPCVQIDVNGIAQGYSVDVLAYLLERNHITNYMVELGGEIRVKGVKFPSGEQMTIGIEAPSKNEFTNEPLQKKIRVKEGAITTSGNYRKFYEGGSKRITHLIDPKSGFPIDNELISVTVVAKDAISADGFDNALMVMGLQKSLAFLKNQKDMEAYFIYHKSDGSIADTATQGFYKLVVSN